MNLQEFETLFEKTMNVLLDSKDITNDEFREICKILMFYWQEHFDGK